MTTFVKDKLGAETRDVHPLNKLGQEGMSQYGGFSLLNKSNPEGLSQDRSFSSLDYLIPRLQGKKILLGITGSIAAFKACDIIRLLRECRAQVKVVLTQGAENFVTRTTLETLSGNPVLTGFWNNPESVAYGPIGTHHIETARWADLILVAPATAHFIAKAAHGMADDLLLTELLAFQGPVHIVPAMNPAMYSHPAVQDNIKRLTGYGTQFLGPTSGRTACGEEGLGRMIEPQLIVEGVAAAFYSPPNGLRALITLGPTRSSLDPVRYLTNRSSGRMGASLCWAALQAGYRVHAICGPTHAVLPHTPGIQITRVQTAQEMAEAALIDWPQSDIYIGTAAVLDWQVKNPSSEKLKKRDGAPVLEFEKNIDILAQIGRTKRPDQYVLGFAAETENPIENAKIKLHEKNCNALFVNDVSRESSGFESELNAGVWLEKGESKNPPSIDETKLNLCSKIDLARTLISKIPIHLNRKAESFLAPRERPQENV